MNAWVAVSGLLVLLVVVLLVLLVREREQRRRVDAEKAELAFRLGQAEGDTRAAERAERAASAESSREWARADAALARAKVAETERDTANARERASHDRLTALLDQMMRSVVPAPAPPAEVRAPAPDPESKAVEAATAHAMAAMDRVIANGAARLLAEHQAAGHPISQSEAEEQARRALNGDGFVG